MSYMFPQFFVAYFPLAILLRITIVPFLSYPLCVSGFADWDEGWFGHEHRDLYYLDNGTLHSSLAAISSDTPLQWHYRLGHPSV